MLTSFKLLVLRWRGVVWHGQVRLQRGVDIRPGYKLVKGSISIGAKCELSQGCMLHGYGGSIILRENVFIGPYAVIYGHGGVEIGKNTLISMHCRILSSEHTIPPRSALIRDQPDICKLTRVGADVWLGAGVTVTGGVTIGDGCVVGTGAVVTHDLPPYSISVGVPAKSIGYRA